MHGVRGSIPGWVVRGGREEGRGRDLSYGFNTWDAGRDTGRREVGKEGWIDGWRERQMDRWTDDEERDLIQIHLSKAMVTLSFPQTCLVVDISYFVYEVIGKHVPINLTAFLHSHLCYIVISLYFKPVFIKLTTTEKELTSVIVDI